MGSYYLIVLAAIFVAVSTFHQEITFYTEVNQGGVGIIFLSSQTDLSNYTAILNNSKSLCVKGE